MASFANASYFLSATNPNTPPTDQTAPSSPIPSALGAGEEDPKRVLQVLASGPLDAATLAAELGMGLPQVEQSVAYLREAGMLQDEAEGRVALSPFAQDAVKILASA